MSIAEFAITPNLSVNALPRVSFQFYRERSEIVAGNEDRDTAELDVNSVRLEHGLCLSVAELEGLSISGNRP